MTQEELEAIKKEMRSLGHRVEVVDLLYHHWMEEFDTLKMEHAKL
jgi:aryl-alcohol dehydrogenase-like predicted oxidoreductase